MVTRSISFGPTDPTADAEGTIGSAYTFATTGRIKQIRTAGYQGTADKSGSAILYLYFKRMTGPFEFVVSFSGGVVEGGSLKETEMVDVDIPYENGEVVTVKVKTAETTTDLSVSLTCLE